jgi:hypothetical protein
MMFPTASDEFLCMVRPNGNDTLDGRSESATHSMRNVVITKSPTRRFLFQTRQAAATPVAEPTPASTPSLAPALARFASSIDRIAVSLDEIRASLDRVAAVLEQMPLNPETAAPAAGNGTKPPRTPRAADEPKEPEAQQERLPLVFS